MKRPRVTILLPTFRRPRLLARALRSALAQTYVDFKLVVYDNASGDETGAVVRAFAATDARLAYVVNPENLGAIGNFNKAMAEVDSEFFCLFSDDDILLPRCLEIEVAGLDAHPQAMAWGGLVISATASRAVACKPYPDWPEGFSDAASSCLRVCRNCRPENAGMLFRSSMIGPRFAPPLPDFVAGDVNWLLQAARAGGIGITNRPTAVFYLHGGSISTTAGASAERGMELYWPSVRHLETLFREENPLPAAIQEACVRSLRWHFGIAPFRQYGRAALAAGERDLAARIVDRLRQDLGDDAGASRLETLSRLPAWLRGPLAACAWWLHRLDSLPRHLRHLLRRRRMSSLACSYLSHYECA